MSNNKSNTRKAILYRTIVVFSGMLVFAGFVMYSLFTIQFVEGSKWRALADSLSTRVFAIEAVRGNIFDSKGNLLATSMPIYDVRIDAQSPAFVDEELFLNKIDSLALGLSVIFNDKPASFYKELLVRTKKAGNRYFLFKRKISYNQLQAMRKLPLFNKGKYKGGLMVNERTRREKPFGLLAERTIGFKQEEGNVRVGLEGYFDKHLSGKSGKRVMQRIAGGTYIPIDDELMIDAQQGRDIVTTIDINLQDVAEQALHTNLLENDADYGTAILMEVATGEIKAIANLTRKSEGEYHETYNYAVGESVEPGSTFKLVSAMALLQDAYMSPTDRVDTEGGQIRFCNLTMKDSHLGSGVMTLQEAFEHSSNVAFAKLMQKYYLKNPLKLYAHYQALGITEKLDFQLSGVGSPVVKGPKSKTWSCTSLPYMAIGYELQLTPLQMLTVFNTIANNGVFVKPLLVKRIEQDGKVIQEFPHTVLNAAVCSPEVAKQLQGMMEGVVLHGTASSLKSNFYSYAGKTGTAVIANRGSGYLAGGGKSYRASFCGYFPAENPKYSCMILISRPRKDDYYAAKVALPVFKEIADKVYASALNLHRELKFTHKTFSKDLPYISLAEKNDVKLVLDRIKLSSHYHNDSIHQDQTEWVNGFAQDNSVAMQPQLLKDSYMPDLRGMGLRDAMYLLEKNGLKVEIKGFGKVRTQSVSPGTKLSKKQLIQLNLG
jgi:cell division protein FtsI (penicillin-binding protein 3)